MYSYLLSLILLLLLNALAHSSGIYRWVDAQGREHFSDRWTPGAKAVEITQRKVAVQQAQAYQEQLQLIAQTTAQLTADRQAREQQQAKSMNKMIKTRQQQVARCEKLEYQLTKLKSSWDVQRRRGYKAGQKRTFAIRRDRLERDLNEICK